MTPAEPNPPIISRVLAKYCLIIHGDIGLMQFVIPGLTRNPVPFWIPAFAGMTFFLVINDAVYRIKASPSHCPLIDFVI